MANTVTETLRGTAGQAVSQVRQMLPEQMRGVNVGDGERLASLLGGGALVIYGLSRESLGGLALAAIGGSLVYRGATGFCHMYDALGINSAGARGPHASVPARSGVRIEKTFTVHRPAAELYRF